MKSFQMVTILVSAALLASACSSGSSRARLGRQCSEHFKGIDMNPGQGEQKLSLKSEDSQMPGGRYVYGGADVYIKFDNGMQILAQDGLVKGTDRYELKVNCVRGVKTNMANTEISSDGVSKLTINGSQVSADARNYKVSIKDTRLSVQASNGASNVDSPSKVYDGKVQDAFMVKTARAEQYEVRSVTLVPGVGTLTIVTKLVRTP